MTRSIVLRFDSTCVDCGASLPAGSTARWFGRGRVSCCGKGAPAAGASPAAPAVAPRPITPRPLSSIANAVHSIPGDAGNGAPRFGDAPLDAELARAVACGLNSTQIARLAEVCPAQRLCVRLSSGARFVVTARDAQHVLACIVESCRDSIRDVMGAAG